MSTGTCTNCGAALPAGEPGRVVSCPKCGYEQRAFAPAHGEDGRPDDHAASLTRRDRKAREEEQRPADDEKRSVRRRLEALDGPPAPPSPQAQAARRWLLVAVMLMLIGAGAAGFFLMRGAGRPADDAPPAQPEIAVATAPAAPLAPPGLLSLAELASLDREGVFEIAAPDPVGSFADFDPVANLAWATAIARAWRDDCVLSSLEVFGVAPDGSLDSAPGGQGWTRFHFFSPHGRRVAMARSGPLATPPLADLDLIISIGKVRVTPLPPGAYDDWTPEPPLDPCPFRRVTERLEQRRAAPVRGSYDLTLQPLGTTPARWMWTDARRASDQVPAEGCPPEPQAEAEPERPQPAEPSAPQVAWRPLDGCSCTMDVDDRPGDETLQLAAFAGGRSIRADSAGIHVTLGMNWMLDDGSDGSRELQTTAETAPPGRLEGMHVALGLACRAPWVVFVWGDRATAWSAPAHALAWTTALDGAFVSPAAAPPPPEPAGGTEALQRLSNEPFTSSCTTLEVRDGAVTIPLDGGGTIRLKLEDGKGAPPEQHGARRRSG